jgi:glycerol-3-phosphate O-acyltransferase
MAVVHVLMRRSGAFFIKRSQQKYKDIYRAILNEYLAKLMLGNHYLEFFIEGTRSRTGKMLPPKLGVLSALSRHVKEGRVRDAFILPVTINYEKILEGNSFTYEMMGEAKVKESLSRVIKAVDVFKENYGRIYLEFCSPISVKEWLRDKQGSF